MWSHARVSWPCFPVNPVLDLSNAQPQQGLIRLKSESTPEFNENMGNEQIPSPPFPVDVLWFYCDPKGVVQGASMVIPFNKCHTDWATLQVGGRLH